MMPAPKGRFPMLALKPILRTFALIALTSLALSAHQARPLPSPPAHQARPSPSAPAHQARPAPSAPLAPIAPASVGVAADRLDRLHKAMQGFVDRKEAA